MILATPTIKDLLVCPVSKVITSAANECKYSGSFTETLCMQSTHFLKTKSEASKEDNPNWQQAMNGLFTDEYWKENDEISTLEEMGAWDIFECEYDIMVLRECGPSNANIIQTGQ